MSKTRNTPTGSKRMQNARITTKIYGDTYSLRANWAEASSQIERETEDGWMPTGMQVGDYGHSTSEAMRDELYGTIGASGDDANDTHIAAEIEAAIASMV